MSYDVQILVNGSRCKQYNQNGKVFIEAKHGSEYVIEVKNHTWQRIMAVCSVDGLDILDGKLAREDAGGYIIPAHGADKFNGFRVSNDKVAKFVFGTKGGSYAASKEDGSERNVGVIGVRLFDEKSKPLPPPVEIHHHHWPKVNPYDPYNPYGPIWTDNTYSTSIGSSVIGDDGGNCCCDFGMVEKSSENLYCNDIPTKSAPTKGKKMSKSLGICDIRSDTISAKCSAKPTRGFDMGTQWGEAKESRVTEVEFEKGVLVFATNIYYASRQSLIEMGVPLSNEKQVSFPEPFADGKYAKPPKNWRG